MKFFAKKLLSQYSPHCTWYGTCKSWLYDYLNGDKIADDFNPTGVTVEIRDVMDYFKKNSSKNQQKIIDELYQLKFEFQNSSDPKSYNRYTRLLALLNHMGLPTQDTNPSVMRI